jgi:cupin 2 domain-containing protein
MAISHNLLSDIPAFLPHELAEPLVESGPLRIERIISRGHASPQDFWYDQPEDEWVVVVQGAARLQFEDKIIEMGPGDWINIPAHRRHRVEWTTPDGPTIWLGVRYESHAPTRPEHGSGGTS